MAGEVTQKVVGRLGPRLNSPSRVDRRLEKYLIGIGYL